MAYVQQRLQMPGGGGGGGGGGWGYQRQHLLQGCLDVGMLGRWDAGMLTPRPVAILLRPQT